MKTLYDKLIEEKIEVNHHESDLYFEVNNKTTKILLEYPLHFNNATRFRCNVSNRLCYDVPFAYIPWWDKVTSKHSFVRN